MYLYFEVVLLILFCTGVKNVKSKKLFSNGFRH